MVFLTNAFRELVRHLGIPLAEKLLLPCAVSHSRMEVCILMIGGWSGRQDARFGGEVLRCWVVGGPGSA